MEPDTGESPSGLPKPGDYRPLEPVWSIVTITYRDGFCGPGKKILAIERNFGQQVSRYFGLPERVNAQVQWQGGGRFLNGFGCAVPDEIAKVYARQWKKNKDLRLPDYLLYPKPDTSANERMKALKDQMDREVASGELSFVRLPGPDEGAQLAESYGAVPGSSTLFFGPKEE